MNKNIKEQLQRIAPLRWLVRQVRKLARPARFLVWHRPKEPFRSSLIEKADKQFGPPFLEVASGTRRLGSEFVNLDLNWHEQVNILADGCRLPFQDSSFGLVWMEAVLEHVPDAQAAVTETLRVLKPGGWVYVEIPFFQGYHADPGDYRRLTMEGLRELFKDFDIEWVRPVAGPASAFCHTTASFLAVIFSFGSAWLYKIWFHYVFSYLFYPIKFLDALIIDWPEAHRIAFGFALLAQKKVR